MRRPEISVVIVNFNTADMLGSCLQSVAADLVDGAWDGVVVDNASTDGSWEAAYGFAPRIRVERNTDNVGFASAVNRAVAVTSGDLILLLNPDCRVHPGMTAVLRAQLDAHPGCAVAAPRVLNPDGSVQGSARGDPTLLTGLFGRTSVLSRVFAGAAVVRRNVPVDDAIRSGAASVPVDWVSGACMLMRRAAVAQVGGFDERYFLYWEDADLCRRLRHAGMEIRYVPDARIEHRAGQSSRTVRRLAVREFHRSAYRYYATHVARDRPHRWLARGILTARCWWRLLGSVVER